MQECSICLNDLGDASTLNCTHVFCKECINKWTNAGGISCPLCRKPYITFDNHRYRNNLYSIGYVPITIDNCTIHEMTIGYPYGYLKHVIYISNWTSTSSAETLAYTLMEYYDRECIKIRLVHPDIIPLPSAAQTSHTYLLHEDT